MVDRFVDNPAPRNESPSFAGTVGREWRQGFLPQAAFHLADSLAPAEDGYRVTPEETKGFEQYSDWFVDSSSRAQTEAIKARIRSNEDEQAYIGRHGGFWSGLAAGALDPINYAIPMLGEGTGLLRGALLSSITNAAGAGVQTWATSKVSPTGSMDDVFANMLYAGAFAGVLGGYLGNKGQAAAHELGTHYARQSQALDARVGGVSMEHAPDGSVAANAPENGGAGQSAQGVTAGVSHESGGAAVDAGASASNVIQFPNAHEPGMPVATAMHPLGEGGAVMGNLALKLEEDLAPAAKADLHVVEGGAEKGAASGETPGAGGGKGKGGGKGGGGDEPPEEPGGPLPNAGGRFKVEPTGAGGYGLAPAYGIEKLFAKLTLGTA
jgi:hypothetical protein